MERTVSGVLETLRPITQSLNADGYDLEVDEVSERLRLRIVAQVDACEDCLVPQEVMLQIVHARLGDAYPLRSIDIGYPSSKHI